MSDEKTSVGVKEEVVLSKFNGDPIPQNEFERIVMVDGIVTQHISVKHGNPAGPVSGSTLIGNDVGTMMVRR